MPQTKTALAYCHNREPSWWRKTNKKGGLNTYFRKIPKNIRSLEVSSGGFSVAVVEVAFTEDESEAVEGAFDTSEFSKDPDDADAMVGDG